MKNRFGKAAAVLCTATALMFSVVATASAHVKVYPQTSTVGAYEAYTMRVPTEKDNPTVKVVLKAPQGVDIQQYQPVTGWSYSVQKDGSGHVTTATWTATAGGILPGQFEEFKFVAKNPTTPEIAAWDAYQYYKDGSIVEWTGDESSKTPHATTNILAATATPAPSAGAPSAGDTSTTAKGNQGDTPWPTILSIIAVVLSVGSLVLSLRRRQK